MEQEVKFIRKLQNEVQQERNQLAEINGEGSARSFEHYRYNVGVIEGLDWVIDHLDRKVRRMTDPNFQEDEDD